MLPSPATLPQPPRRLMGSPPTSVMILMHVRNGTIRPRARLTALSPWMEFVGWRLVNTATNVCRSSTLMENQKNAESLTSVIPPTVISWTPDTWTFSTTTATPTTDSLTRENMLCLTKELEVNQSSPGIGLHVDSLSYWSLNVNSSNFWYFFLFYKCETFLSLFELQDRF